MSMSTQNRFLGRLEENLPAHLEVDFNYHYSNTGMILIRRAHGFQTVLSIYFNWQDSYVIFEMTPAIETQVQFRMDKRSHDALGPSGTEVQVVHINSPFDDLEYLLSDIYEYLEGIKP